MSTEEEVNEIERKREVCIDLKRKQILQQKAIAAQKLAEKLRREREERKKNDEDTEFLKKIDDFLKTLKLNLKF
tara:strand:- start:8638 stop:8859 length:222 start_codon:yes stop_codon:yes gene_type:complete